MTTPPPPTSPPQPVFVDRHGAAAILTISVSTLAHLAGRGGPPMIRIGRRRFYKVTDLIVWAEAHRETPRRGPGRPRKGR